MPNDEHTTREPVQEEAVSTPDQEPEELVSKVGSVKDIFKDLSELSMDEPNTNVVILPCGKGSALDKLINYVNNALTDDVLKTNSTERNVTIGINTTSRAKAYPNDALYEKANKDSSELVNSVEYADKELGIRKVGVSATGKLSGGNALAKFNTALGLGRYVTVTLWHSGFSLTLKPPKETDIINLHYSIATAERKLGSDTNNLIYSNYGVIINKLLLDFVMDHVVSSTLAISDEEDYLDYIDLKDLNPLAAAMATAMDPDGCDIVMSCKNSLITNDDGPICDYTAKVHIIPEELLWVNRGILTNELLEHVSMTAPGSHTPDSIKHYQNMLTVNREKVVKLKSSTGTEIVFVLKSPTLETYLNQGEFWVNKVISDTEGLFSQEDTDKTKDNKVDVMVATTVLNTYNTYIKQISLEDSYVEDAATITDVLETLSTDDLIVTSLLAEIRDYINDGFISVVATYNYNCPVCTKAGRDAGQGSGDALGFKEFIPLNAVEHFFDLSTLKFTQIVTRSK